MEVLWTRRRTAGFDPSHQPALGLGLVAFALWACVLVGKVEGFGADSFLGFLTALLFLDSQVQFVMAFLDSFLFAKLMLNSQYA